MILQVLRNARWCLVYRRGTIDRWTDIVSLNRGFVRRCTICYVGLAREDSNRQSTRWKRLGHCNSCENVAAEQWIYIAILLNITYNGWDKPWWKRAEITTKTWTIKRENDTKYNTLYRADIEVEYEWYHVVYCGNKGNDFQISVYIWFYADVINVFEHMQ